jgi:hypothetical protein
LRLTPSVASAGVRLGSLFAVLAFAAEAHAGDEDLSAGATLRAETTGRGDRDLVALGAIRRGGTTLSLGYGQLAGRNVPERHALLASLSQELAEVREEPVELEVETRLAPDQAGVARREIQAFGRWSGLGVGFQFRTTDASTAGLVAIGVAFEASRTMGSFTAGVGGSIFDLNLRAPRTADVWSRFSRRTLDWAERWSVCASLGAREGALTAELSASLGSPPAAPLTQQVELKVEAKILRAVLVAKAGFLAMPAGLAPSLGAEVRLEP